MQETGILRGLGIFMGRLLAMRAGWHLSDQSLCLSAYQLQGRGGGGLLSHLAPVATHREHLVGRCVKQGAGLDGHLF